MNWRKISGWSILVSLILIPSIFLGIFTSWMTALYAVAFLFSCGIVAALIIFAINLIDE